LEIRRGCHVTVMESGKFLGNDQHVAAMQRCIAVRTCLLQREYPPYFRLPAAAHF
jgi:hypothetical protein